MLLRLIVFEINSFGRIFWKEAIEKYNKDNYPNLTIVFLGDYVDPYDFEGITRKDAMKLVAKDRGVSKRDIYQALLEE